MTKPSIHSDYPDFIKYTKDALVSGSIPQMLSTRILPSFLSSVHRNQITEFSSEAIACWTVDMLLQPLKTSTVKRYLGALSTFYSEWKNNAAHLQQNLHSDCNNDASTNANQSDPDFKINERHAGSLPDFDDIKRVQSNLKIVEKLSDLRCMPYSNENTMKCAFIYLLTNPNSGLTDVIDITHNDTLPDFLPTDFMTSMRKMPQAKYVFPLEQGKHRRQAIIRNIISGIHSVARKTGMDFGSSFSRDSITSLWIAEGLRLGIPLAEIRALSMDFKLPAQYGILTAIRPALIDENRKTEIRNMIASSFIKDTNAWYAMRLRPGVTPDMIKDELLRLKFPPYRDMEFFYPVRYQKKAVRNKMQTVEVPVVPSILFFRMRGDYIPYMMSLVGQMAWVYRASSSKESPYSSIPIQQMDIFMKSVMNSEASSAIDITTSLPPLAVGDEVVIENGTIFDGMHGVIRKVRSKDGSLMYSLRLSDTAYLQWKEVTLPAANISKSE